MRVRSIVAVGLLCLTTGVGSCGGDSSGRNAGPGASVPGATRRPHGSTPRPTARPASIPVVTGAAARRKAVPILMYHVLGSPPASAPLPELWVSKATFQEQLAALARAGYQAVTLKAVFGAWESGGPLPRRPMVVSFDDGYYSHASIAAPALRTYGWPGVLNLALQDLGPDGLPRHLAQRMAKDDGWEIDSHTLTHPDLTTLDDARLRAELTGSRDRIKAIFGEAPQFFCYPAGKYDAHVEAAVRAAGYRGATTELPGAARRSDDAYALPRIRITNADTGSALVRRLQAATS